MFRNSSAAGRCMHLKGVPKGDDLHGIDEYQSTAKVQQKIHKIRILVSLIKGIYLRMLE